MFCLLADSLFFPLHRCPGNAKIIQLQRSCGAKMDLFTIGYEGLDQRQFIAHLVHNKISVVADVRHLPLSRKKGFSKS